MLDVEPSVLKFIHDRYDGSLLYNTINGCKTITDFLMVCHQNTLKDIDVLKRFSTEIVQDELQSIRITHVGLPCLEFTYKNYKVHIELNDNVAYRADIIEMMRTAVMDGIIDTVLYSNGGINFGISVYKNDKQIITISGSCGFVYLPELAKNIIVDLLSHSFSLKVQYLLEQTKPVLKEYEKLFMTALEETNVLLWIRGKVMSYQKLGSFSSQVIGSNTIPTIPVLGDGIEEYDSLLFSTRLLGMRDVEVFRYLAHGYFFLPSYSAAPPDRAIVRIFHD